MKNTLPENEYYIMCKSFVEYTDLLNQDRENQKTNFLINTGMLPHENFNCKLMTELLPKGYKTDEFKLLGLEIKMMHMIQSLNYANELIIQSNQLYQFIGKASPMENYMSVYNFNKLFFLNEDIVHRIKKFFDEMISITYILKYGGENIVINEIGKYIKDGQSLLNEYDQFKNFFSKLNDIDNAFKHSYSNTLLMGYIKGDENTIIVQYSKRGKKIYNPQTITITMNELVKNTNDFYCFSFHLIDDLLTTNNDSEKNNQ